jgi:hypothetical protein
MFTVLKHMVPDFDRVATQYINFNGQTRYINFNGQTRYINWTTSVKMNAYEVSFTDSIAINHRDNSKLKKSFKQTVFIFYTLYNPTPDTKLLLYQNPEHFISIHFHTCSSVDISCLSIKVDISCLSIKVDILCVFIKVDISCLSIKVDISCLSIKVL